jgi:hypothetical protein
METTMENDKNYLERNVSRLVKLAGDPATPGKGFTDSLMSSALQELSADTGAASKTTFLTGRIDRAMGMAAAVAIVCGAAVQIVLTAAAWANPVLGGTLLVTMCVNWLSYVGQLIL